MSVVKYLRVPLTIGVAIASAVAAAQQVGSKSSLVVIASNHDLATGQPLEAEFFQGADLTPKPVSTFSANLVGNTGAAEGMAFASAGILKASGKGTSIFQDVIDGPPGLDSDIYGGGNVRAEIEFTDKITILNTGVFFFQWAVTGYALSQAGTGDDMFPTFATAEGNFSVMDSATHQPVGSRIEFTSTGTNGHPQFANGVRSFNASLNAGDELFLFGTMKLDSECHGGGWMDIDYGHSAYTVIQRGLNGVGGPGGFTSESGYA
ncbi:hypothetical protein EON82_23255, partial [bacterium]